jgi:hypothetical protein
LQDFWCDGGVDGAKNSDKNAYQVSTVSSIRRDVQNKVAIACVDAMNAPDTSQASIHSVQVVENSNPSYD